MTGPRGATVPLIRRLMTQSPYPECTVKGSGRDRRLDTPGWEVSTFWTDRRFVLLHFAYWMDNRWDSEREENGLVVLRHLARWIADQGFVVYLVPDRDRDGQVRHPYALVGRVGNEPRAWVTDFRDRDKLQAERLDPQLADADR